MKKILVFLSAFVFSCSGTDDSDPVVSSYNVELTTTCPSLNRSTYCVTKVVYDKVLLEIKNSLGQACVYTEINTISDGVKKGYILGAGIGCK